jgi:hypothetical protein
MNQRGEENSTKHINGNVDVNWTKQGWLISRETFSRIREDLLTAAL